MTSSKNGAESEPTIKDQELLDIDGDIEKAKNYLLVWAVICFIGYLILLILWKFDGAPNAASFGGTLGDYFGGLLNPVVAFAAFYWLTKGVRIQKQELSDTRKALSDQVATGRESVEKLNEQVAYARTSVRIDALTGMINAHTSDIAYRREHLAFLMSQKVAGTSNIFHSMRGRTMTRPELDSLVANLNHGIDVRAKERVLFATEIHMLLKATRTAAERNALQGMTVQANTDDDGAP